MNVLAINGSPKPEGNTYHAIKTVADELALSGIETEIITIGNKAIRGCISCYSCSSTGLCVFNDEMNDIALKMKKADGIIIGSPVYYAGINGTLKSFLDRAFFTSSKHFRFKPCAAIVSARRAGTTAALQTINQYFEFSEMLITPTVYWSGVHGGAPAEMIEDLEGVQILKQLGKNMAYLLNMKAQSNITPPEKDQRVFYNYIRN